MFRKANGRDDNWRKKTPSTPAYFAGIPPITPARVLAWTASRCARGPSRPGGCHTPGTATIPASRRTAPAPRGCPFLGVFRGFSGFLVCAILACFEPRGAVFRVFRNVRARAAGPRHWAGEKPRLLAGDGHYFEYNIHVSISPQRPPRVLCRAPHDVHTDHVRDRARRRPSCRDVAAPVSPLGVEPASMTCRCCALAYPRTFPLDSSTLILQHQKGVARRASLDAVRTSRT